jgi:hypothetical protein
VVASRVEQATLRKGGDDGSVLALASLEHLGEGDPHDLLDRSCVQQARPQAIGALVRLRDETDDRLEEGVVVGDLVDCAAGFALGDRFVPFSSRKCGLEGGEQQGTLGSAEFDGLEGDAGVLSDVSEGSADIPARGEEGGCGIKDALAGLCRLSVSERRAVRARGAWRGGDFDYP